MKNTLDILHVTFNKSPADETVISVAKVVNGKIYVLKMELGEQADILYRLLTEKTAKVEIKAESKEQDTISRQETLKYFEGWKNQIKYYHPYAKNFDIPYEEAIQRIKDVPPVKCVSLEKPNKCEDAISRQMVLDVINTDWHEDLSQLEDAIKALPPVEPKTGHWIKSQDSYGNYHFTCPFCEHDIATKADVWEDNYCSNCGAKLKEAEDDKDN